MRRILEQEPDVVWSIEPVIDATCLRLDYSAESPEGRALESHLGQRPVDLRMKEVARELMRLGYEATQGYAMGERSAT